MNKLEEARKSINEIDKEMAELFVKRMEAAKLISEYKMEINDYIDMLAVWYRDVLLFKATNDANHLIFKDEIQYIKKVAKKSSYEGIENIIDALEKAKARLVLPELLKRQERYLVPLRMYWICFLNCHWTNTILQVATMDIDRNRMIHR